MKKWIRKQLGRFVRWALNPSWDQLDKMCREDGLVLEQVSVDLGKAENHISELEDRLKGVEHDLERLERKHAD